MVWEFQATKKGRHFFINIKFDYASFQGCDFNVTAYRFKCIYDPCVVWTFISAKKHTTAEMGDFRLDFNELGPRLF